MRTLVFALATAAFVAGCTTSPPQPRSAASEQQLQRLLAGKAAGQPRTCLPSYRTSSDMVIIDDNTVLFRDGGRRVWRTEMRGHCSSLGSGFYTIVTRTFGGQGPCAGEIAQLVDLSSGMVAGSCVWGDFVPYTRTGG
jgi:hypothetical protein